jgi:hypothetical protein
MSRAWNFRPTRTDRDTKIVVNKCAICGKPITETADNLEVNGTCESEYEKDEPRLILRDHRQKEYLITGYKID